MRIRTLILVLVTCAVFVSSAAFAQDQPSSSDPQAQMQQMREKIIQNMQAKGIDPQEFFSQIRDQMQNGTFDPADLNRMLVEKGIIDQQSLTQMQTTMQSATMSRIKEQLAASDEEWKVIQPKLQKVLSATASANQTGPSRWMTSFMGSQANAAASKAMNDLKAALKDPKTSPDTIGLKLQAWRDAHEKAKAELTAAQKELVDVLTVRQEATLMNMGLIQ